MELQTGVVPDISESYGGTLRLEPAAHVKGLGAVEPAWVSLIGPDQLPASFSLIGSISSAEDQALRGTCSTFAALLAGQHIVRRDLSEQHTYNIAWRFENRPSHTGEGTSLDAVFAALTQGICEGAVWPYDPFPRPGNLPHDPIPPEVQAARKFNITSWSSLTLPALARGKFVASCLFTGKCPVVLSLPTFWNGSCGWEEGFLIDLPPDDPPLAGWHAIAAVGYDIESQFIIVQNSWGVEWGIAGLGLISFAYIDRYLRSAYVANGAPQ